MRLPVGSAAARSPAHAGSGVRFAVVTPASMPPVLARLSERSCSHGSAFVVREDFGSRVNLLILCTGEAARTPHSRRPPVAGRTARSAGGSPRRPVACSPGGTGMGHGNNGLHRFSTALQGGTRAPRWPRWMTSCPRPSLAHHCGGRSPGSCAGARRTGMPRVAPRAVGLVGSSAAHSRTSSTRRLFFRPSGVSLLSIGRYPAPVPDGQNPRFPPSGAPKVPTRHEPLQPA
jgi:hypothetical protein